MKNRRNFLSCAAGGLLAASSFPSGVFAQDEISTMAGVPKVVRDSEGTRVWAMGILVTVKVKAADTGGAYSVFEDYVPPGAGPVPHTHTKEDETIFVLDGKLRAWLSGKECNLQQGDFVHMPRGVQHYFKNVSDEPTRMLLTYTPGGFEQWFLDVGTAAENGARVSPNVTQKDIKMAVSEAKKYGVQFTTP
jgi:quercetin dioxygenase-like cupin family protein